MYHSYRDSNRLAKNPGDDRAPSEGQGDAYDLPNEPGIFFGDIRRDAQEFANYLRDGAIAEDRVIAVMRRGSLRRATRSDQGKPGIDDGGGFEVPARRAAA